MKVTSIASDIPPNVVSFSDKVMGEFATHEEFEAFAQDLDNLQIDNVEVLDGESGEIYIREARKSVTGFLDSILGDLESEMLREYERALALGHVVFAVPEARNKRDSIVNLAVDHGAKHVAHFGTFVNESF
jgi:hypothetical protein